MPEHRGEPGDVAFFERIDNHMPRAFVAVMRRLPAEPRCRLCRAPFGGVGGRIMRRVGFGPSRKNPTLCNTCFERAPMGGVETEVGVLFADVRGFTSLAEGMPSDEVAGVLNRFYSAATRVLGRTAVIDKLVGDQVMALYLPALVRGAWEDEMFRDATELLAEVGSWLRLGVGLDVGVAFVGNVGSGEVKDFTAIGDVVNTAARLQSVAEAGQIVVSERLFGRLSSPPPAARVAGLELKGKAGTTAARVIDA
jgi:adenylate cyclase